MKEKYISVSLVESPFLLSSYAVACDSNKKHEQQMIDNLTRICETASLLVIMTDQFLNILKLRQHISGSVEFISCCIW